MGNAIHSATTLTGGEPGQGCLTLRPEWEPDWKSSQCTLCRESFSLIHRRHHCRSCGKIVCNSCSGFQIKLERLGYDNEVRVCNHCWVFEACVDMSSSPAVLRSPSWEEWRGKEETEGRGEAWSQYLRAAVHIVPLLGGKAKVLFRSIFICYVKVAESDD